MSLAGWLPRTGIRSANLYSAIEYGLTLPLQCWVTGWEEHLWNYLSVYVDWIDWRVWPYLFFMESLFWCCSVFPVYLCMSALVVVIILISWGRSSVIGKEQRLWNCLLSCWLWSESCDCILPRAGSGAQWALDLIFRFWRYIYCLLAYMVCFNTYHLFFTFSLLISTPRVGSGAV